VCGIHFPNPIGLAAGFAKKPVGLHGLAALGFGFIELGTITQHAQEGNPRPRIFRLPHERALINRMGFNNPGADEVAYRLEKLRPLGIPLGINIGKSKKTRLEEAEDDYAESFSLLNRFADYLVANVSSPNTVGLRTLQEKEPLRRVLRRLREVAAQRHLSSLEPIRPLFVKVTVDLGLPGIDELLEVCQDLRIEGIIVSNTTLERDRVMTPTTEAGGLSGPPLRVRACKAVAHIRNSLPGIAIIGVGGLGSPEDIQRMQDAGADLFQIYTSFIYEGPLLPRRLLLELANRS
jgi:dihydroorotate dehydrogenase